MHQNFPHIVAQYPMLSHAWSRLSVYKHTFYPVTENPILNNVRIRWIPFSCIAPRQYIAQGINNSTVINYRWERHKSLERKYQGATPLGKPSSRLNNNIKMGLELRREAANPLVCVMFWIISVSCYRSTEQYTATMCAVGLNILPCLLQRPYIWLHTVYPVWVIGPTQPPVQWESGLSRG